MRLTSMPNDAPTPIATNADAALATALWSLLSGVDWARLRSAGGEMAVARRNHVARITFRTGQRTSALDVLVELAVELKPVNPFDFLVDPRCRELPFVSRFGSFLAPRGAEGLCAPPGHRLSGGGRRYKALKQHLLHRLKPCIPPCLCLAGLPP